MRSYSRPITTQDSAHSGEIFSLKWKPGTVNVPTHKLVTPRKTTLKKDRPLFTTTIRDRKDIKVDDEKPKLLEEVQKPESVSRLEEPETSPTPEEKTPSNESPVSSAPSSSKKSPSSSITNEETPSGKNIIDQTPNTSNSSLLDDSMSSEASFEIKTRRMSPRLQQRKSLASIDSMKSSPSNLPRLKNSDRKSVV